MAITTAISLYRGEDTTIDFTMADGDDITGWVIVFTVSRSKNISTKLFAKTCTLTTPESGLFQTTVDAEDTEDLQPGRYYWDAWRTDSSAARLLGVGAFTILSNVRIPV